jgi:hypothetical protein
VSETIGLLLLFALIPVAVMDWITVGILTSARRRDGTALRERHGVAVILAVAVTLYFLVGLNTVLGFPLFGVPIAAIINRSIYLTIGIIPARFLYLLWRRRF